MLAGAGMNSAQAGYTLGTDLFGGSPSTRKPGVNKYDYSRSKF
jgi:hypothetical protein